MDDLTKTKAQLVAELAELRQRVARLEGTAPGDADSKNSLEHFLPIIEDRTIFNEAPLGIALLDKDSRFVRVNRQWAAMLGYAPSELLGTRYDDVTHPDDTRSSIVRRQGIRQGKFNTYSVEKRFVRKDGNTLRGNLFVSALRNARGSLSAFLCMVVDITEQYQIEDALRASEEKYRRLFEQAGDSIFIIELATGRILDANENAARRLGYTLADLRAMTINDIEQPLPNVDSSAAVRQSQSSGSLVSECLYRRADGSTFPVEVSSRIIKYGGKEVLQNFARDITERLRAKAALTQERNLLRTLIDNLPDSVTLKDCDSRFVLNNRESQRRLGGATADALRGRTDFDIFPPEMAQAFFEAEQQVMASGEPNLAQETLVQNAQGERWVLISRIPLYDAEGEVSGVLGIGQDITAIKAAQEALRAREEQYRNLVENINEVIFSLDIEGRFTYISPVIERISGYTPDEVMGKDFFAFVHPDDLPDLLASFQRTVQGEEEPFTFRVLTRTGDLRYVRTHSRLVFDGDQPRGLTGVMSDITATVLAEQEIRLLNQFREAIIESANVHVSVLDRDQHFIVWNKAAERITGYTREEVLGHNKVWEWAYPDEEYRRRVAAKSAAAIRGESIEALPLTLRTKNGEYRTIAFYARQLTDEQGNSAGVVNVGIDITEQQKAEAALRASEARYRLLADNAADVIWTMNPEGQFTYVSPSIERLRGHTADEVMTQSLDSVLTPESLAVEQAAWQALLREVEQGTVTASEDTYELEQRRRDGSTVWTETRAQVMLDDEGQFSGVLGVTRDISERRAAQQKALAMAMELQRIQVLEQFIGNASHDLKTPLTTMKLSLGVLRRSQDPDRQQQHLDILAAQVTHLQRLLEDLLDMTRMDKEGRLEHNSLDLQTLLAEVVEEHHALAEAKKHTLQATYEAADWTIDGDYDKLHSALTNLLRNAINYTPNDGTIDVRLQRQGSKAVIEFQDSGIGISPDEQAHIFERFYRANKARSSDKGGMGLGLAIARSIIEAHDGTIMVESVPDQGSTFRVTLPLKSPLAE